MWVKIVRGTNDLRAVIGTMEFGFYVIHQHAVLFAGNGYGYHLFTGFRYLVQQRNVHGRFAVHKKCLKCNTELKLAPGWCFQVKTPVAPTHRDQLVVTGFKIIERDILAPIKLVAVNRSTNINMGTIGNKVDGNTLFTFLKP